MAKEFMTLWKQARVGLLIIVFGGVSAATLKLLAFPNPKDRTHGTYTFPQTVPLADWQFQGSSAIVPPSQPPGDPKLISAWQYKYTQSQQPQKPLTIGMYYLVSTKGDVNFLLKRFTPSTAEITASEVKQQQAIGRYKLFTQDKQAHLTSCINPYGGSTITGREFDKNRNQNDLRLSRLLPWLTSRVDLKDTRCLWVKLSLPLSAGESPTTAYTTLETAWTPWYQWWQTRFPAP
jgi:cyanosortase A-associated protein